MAGLERLSPLDSMLLSAETPTQHLHIVAVMITEPISDDLPGSNFELYRARIHERFHLVAALRQKLQRGPFGTNVWVDDPDIHVDSHLHHALIGPEATLDDLAAVVGAVASEPLPRDRPLWESWAVDGLAGRRGAVVAKLHHAAIDGVSGFNSLGSLYDLQPDPGDFVPPGWEPTAPATPVDLVSSAAREVSERSTALLGRAREVAGFARGVLAARDRSPLPGTGPRLPWNKALTPRRSTAFTHVPLSDVKAVAKTFDVTVNDAVLALTTGALREYLAKRDVLPDRPIIAGVPVSEREPEHGLSGNRFSAMFYELPVHLDDPVERLVAVGASAQTAKDLYAQSGERLLENVAGLVPPALAGGFARLLSGLRVANVAPPLVNLFVSNIRGPAFPLYAAGYRVTHMYPMGPLIEGVGLGLTVGSYCDSVDFGFMACTDLVPDLLDIARAVEHELDRLTGAAG